MFSFLKNNFFTSHNQKTLNSYNKLLEKVNQEEEHIKKLADSDLKYNTKKFKDVKTRRNIR